MDNGIVVALSSIATAIVAGSITLLSKVVDAFQKKNEQSMVLKTTYVNKKIEAGQMTIAGINIVIQKFHIEVNNLRHLKEGVKQSDEFIEGVVAARKAVMELALMKNDFTEVYFNINSFTDEEQSIADVLNEKVIALNRTVYTSDRSTFLEDVNEVINLLNRNIKLYRRMNDYIRNDLAKYDIVQ